MKMPPTLYSRWLKTVKADPAAAALLDASSGRVWSRAALEASGLAWANEAGRDVRGRAVVFAEPNGPEWMRVFLGILAADALAVALDPGEPLAAQQSLAAKVGAGFLWRMGQLERLDDKQRTAHRSIRLLKITSGSTGTPNALPFTDAQMAADGRQICATMGINPADVNLGCIPLGHSYGLGNLVMPLLLQGTAIVSGADVLPHGLATAIAKWRPTVFPAVPALLRALAESEVDPRQLRSLRTVISAGAPLPPEVARAFKRKFNLVIHNFYGSSETGGIAYDRTGAAALSGRSVGRPLNGVRLKFSAGRRFWVESAAVGGAGRFRPADRGELNNQGELVLRGRAGRLVKIGGRRLDLAEVEHALRAVPGVEDAYVELSQQRADSLAAAIATDRTVGEVRTLLADRIAGWKIPRKILAMAAFPLTPRGKVDTRRLRSALQATAQVTPGRSPTPRSPR